MTADNTEEHEELWRQVDTDMWTGALDAEGARETLFELGLVRKGNGLGFSDGHGELGSWSPRAIVSCRARASSSTGARCTAARGSTAPSAISCCRTLGRPLAAGSALRRRVRRCCWNGNKSGGTLGSDRAERARDRFRPGPPSRGDA